MVADIVKLEEYETDMEIELGTQNDLFVTSVDHEDVPKALVLSVKNDLGNACAESANMWYSPYKYITKLQEVH